MKYAIRFLMFWYDFLVGDAWEIAAGIVAALAVGAALLRGKPEFAGVFAFVLAIAVAVVLVVSVWLGWRERQPRAR